jgi:hypothetical protein
LPENDLIGQSLNEITELVKDLKQNMHERNEKKCKTGAVSNQIYEASRKNGGMGHTNLKELGNSHSLVQRFCAFLGYFFEKNLLREEIIHQVDGDYCKTNARIL